MLTTEQNKTDFEQTIADRDAMCKSIQDVVQVFLRMYPDYPIQPEIQIRYQDLENGKRTYTSVSVTANLTV